MNAEMTFDATRNYDPHFSLFYNVGEAVGDGCPNLSEDVILVQYLLHRIYRKTGAPPAGELKIDGVCGTVTKSWIHKFQWDVWYEGNEIYPDGIVSPARVGGCFSTVFYLNEAMKKFDRRTYFLMSRMQMQISSPPSISFPQISWGNQPDKNFAALAA